MIAGARRLPESTVFEAVDGQQLRVPLNWNSGGGAWSCMQSHRHVLKRAIMDGVESLLVFEDDACFRPTFAGCQTMVTGLLTN